MATISLGNFFNVGGRTVLGGTGGSGLDTEALINAMVEAKSFPKIRLEDRVELNTNKLTALSEFRTLLSTFQDASNFLRNPPGVANASENIFQYRDATLTSNTSIAGSTYLSATIEPGASVQTYTVSDITSLARAKKQKTGSIFIADTNTAVVTTAATPGLLKAGTVTINGQDLTLEEGDSLATVISRFNEVKSLTGIEASILQVDEGEYAIIFSATATGLDADFDLNDAGTVTDPDGVLSMISRTNLLTNGTFATNIASWTNASIGTGTIAWDGAGALEMTGGGAAGNEAFAQQAMTTVIGQEYTVTATLADLTSSAYIRIGSDSVVGNPGNFDIEDYEVAADGTVSFTFTATGTTTYLTINSDANIAPFTVDAISVVSNAVTPVTDAQTASNAIFKIDGVDIVRQGNSISDVVSNVTLTLNAITPALTEIEVDVDANRELAKNGIISFINAYNDLKLFAAEQSRINDEGVFAEDAYLATDPLLRSTMNSVSAELSAIVAGLSGSLESLAEIGITFTDLPEGPDHPFVRNILTLDEDKLDSVLASDYSSVENLFGFTFTANNANLAIFSRTNALSVTSFTLNIDPGTETFEATYDDGSGPETVEVTATEMLGGGYTLRGVAGTALEGLVMVYGSSSSANISVTATQGFGDRMYNVLQTVLQADTGELDLRVDAVETNSTRAEEEITRIDEQVEQFREQLLRKFSALESMIASVNTLLQSLDASSAARQANQ